MSPSVIEWYSGKNVLITGGTGYMGKVLIVKLLKSIPDIGKIFLLCRQKKNLSPSSRLAEMIKLPIFQSLREENPNALKKITVVEGDTGLDGLGLLQDVKESIKKEVHIIFNFAASLKLEADIQTSVNLNTHGTLRVLQLAEEMPNLQVFTHLSTAFCQCEVEVVEEKIYSPPADPRSIISTLEWMDRDLAEALTPKLLGSHPNCYTYSKKLTEALVAEFKEKFPIVIIRPSIVTPAVKEPLPGWVDSLNGPIGVTVAGAKGVIRSMLCNPHNRAEVIPVDIAINAVIITSWKKATNGYSNDVDVYNLTAGSEETATWGELLIRGKEVLRDYPLDAGLWYPNGTVRTNPFIHHLVVFFLQTVPAYLIDFLMLIFRQKRFMVRIQNRISVGMTVLQYFTMRKWNFKNDKCLQLASQLNEREKEIFYIKIAVDKEEYIKNTIIGARVYCMKEPMETLPAARSQMRRLYWLDLTTKVGFVTFLLWICTKYILILKAFLQPELRAFSA